MDELRLAGGRWTHSRGMDCRELRRDNGDWPDTLEDERRTPMEEVRNALHAAQRLMQRHIRDGNLGSAAYAEFRALVDAAAALPGAQRCLDRITLARWDGVIVYSRPVGEVESALRARLTALDVDIMRRLNAAGAAYAIHPSLRPYFDQEAEAVAAMPASPLRDNLLEHVDRVRADVRRKFGSGA